MNILVIPDIHTHHEKAERICQKYKDHKIVFIGDYFDQFNDSVEDNMFTAEWLKESLGKQNRIHLRGNHDEHYDPRVSSICSGYSNQKKAGINKVLSIEDWDKLKYFHFENKWLFSHAGVNQYWFGNPVVDGLNLDKLQAKIDDAIIKQRSGQPDNAIWGPSFDRGGSNKHGSILWEDWRSLEMLPKLKQCVGHTPLPKIQKISDEISSSMILNVDNSAMNIYMSEVVEINENGNTNIINTAYV